MLAKLALGASAPPPTYVDDVFSAYTYTGNGTGQKIANGFNLSSGDPDYANTPLIVEFEGSAVNRVTSTSLSLISGVVPTYQTSSAWAKFGRAASAFSASVVDDLRETKYGLGISQPNFNNPWCVEFYASGGSASGTGSAAGSGAITVQFGDTTNGVQINCFNDTNVNYAYFHVFKDTGSVTAGTSTVPQTPSHFRFTYNGTVIAVYIDGVFQASTAFTGWTSQPQVSVSQFLNISGYTGDTTTARGRICIHSLRVTFGSSRVGQPVYLQQPPSTSVDGAGLVWVKGTASQDNHVLADSTGRGVSNLNTANTNARVFNVAGLATTNTGFTLHGAAGNGSSQAMVAWMFKKAPKFFDVVTYTGNNTAGRQIAHGLGVAPGMIIVKNTSSASSWRVYHRGMTSAAYRMNLETTATQSLDNSAWNSTAPTATVFTLGGDLAVNSDPETYVAYLFAHDTDTVNGIVQCGSFTSTVSALTVSLGWEPQYVLYKRINVAADWNVMDASRGFQVDRSGATVKLAANTMEAQVAYGEIGPTAAGFTHTNGTAGDTYVYLAIRRSNKPPTLGTHVYNAIARTSGATTPVTGAGFPPDLILAKYRTMAYPFGCHDRLRGVLRSITVNSTTPEALTADSITAFGMDGWTAGTDGNVVAANAFSNTAIYYVFKRSLGVFDMVCYIGDGASTPTRSISHSLGVKPELLFLKSRSLTGDWIAVANTGSGYVYSSAASNFALNSTAFPAANMVLSTTYVSASAFQLGFLVPDVDVNATQRDKVNASDATYVAYLFASKAGISKVGSYTGNGGAQGTTGTSQTINCGFTTGARFLLIKRTNSTSDWFVWDSARGIVAAEDPHLSFNTAVVEVTTNDSVDPDPGTNGFIVNQLAATNINVTASTYIYLAFA